MGQLNEDITAETRTDYETPGIQFALLDEEFHFTIDGAADAANSKCERFWGEADDCLQTSWSREVVFLNPPYGRSRNAVSGKKQSIGLFIQKAHEESLKGAVAVLLIPARPDTIAWHAYCHPFGQRRWRKPRIKRVVVASALRRAAEFQAETFRLRSAG